MFVEYLRETRGRYTFELFAWVVMPEHVHLLVRPVEEQPVAPILYHLKRSFALDAIDHWHATRDGATIDQITRPDGSFRVWQKGGGFGRNVRDHAEFCREVVYTHRNPVKRGLVAAPADWAWSSARWWLGMRENVPIECDPPPGIEPVAFDQFV